MSKLDFLEEQSVDEPVEAAVEAPVVEQPAAEPETPPAETPEPQAKAQIEPGFVPISVVLDERFKRQAVEAENARLKQQQPAPQPVAMPDIFEDPAGYDAAVQSQIDQRIYNQTRAISERFAVQQYGKETTDAAVQWGMAKCDADPYFNARVRQSADPVGMAVQEYQRDLIASQVTGDDFEKFTAWKAAQQTITPQPDNPLPSIPPRSIASIPSAGGVDHVPVGPGVAYDGIFQR